MWMHLVHSYPIARLKGKYNYKELCSLVMDQTTGSRFAVDILWLPDCWLEVGIRRSCDATGHLGTGFS